MTTETQASPAPGAQSPGTQKAVRLTAPGIRSLKGRRKIAALTSYDAPTAALLDAAGVDLLLVGDSVEMVVYGAADTLGASLERMVAHARAVSGAARRAPPGRTRGRGRRSRRRRAASPLPGGGGPRSHGAPAP